MSVDPKAIHSERHIEVGALLQQDAGIIIQRWSGRAVEEQAQAKRLHHETLLDDLPAFLQAMGQHLADRADGNGRHRRPAGRHGEQRWQAGWSLAEVVRDYQILRLVILDYLEESLDRPLAGREVMAVGLVLDEAIAASIASYSRHHDEAVRRSERHEADRRQEEADGRHRREVEAAHERERRKDDFLALLGHELRNPLAPVSNAVHLLRLRGSDPALLGWATDLLDRQARHMTRLVDELLDVSRIGRGKMLLHRETVDLVQLMRTAVEDHRATLEEAGLKVHLELPAGSIHCQGDGTRFAQIVGNLLANAAKFTDPGGKVFVGAHLDPQAKRVMVSVRDTGIGIEPDALRHLFDRFARPDRGLARSRGGLGLGLTLVKGLVELHGGQVQAASDGPGKGSTFTFWLPYAENADDPAQAAAGPTTAARPLRILVIEDNPDAADSLHLLLELMGHTVRLAYTGPAGVQAARQAPPDVVLCDLGLPGMTGFAVARALRQDPALVGVRLVAFSGYGSEADRHEGREAGFDLHLTKPVDPAELERLLASVAPAGLA